MNESEDMLLFEASEDAALPEAEEGADNGADADLFLDGSQEIPDADPELSEDLQEVPLDDVLFPASSPDGLDDAFSSSGSGPLDAEILDRLDSIAQILQDADGFPLIDQDPGEAAELSPTPTPTPEPDLVLAELRKLSELQEEQSAILGEMSGDVYMLRRPMDNINNAMLVVTVGIGILVGVMLMTILSMYLRH